MAVDRNDDAGKGGDAGSPLDPGGRLDVTRLVAEHGDAKAALAVLARKLDEVERDNKAQRDQIRAYEAAAPEGSVILPPADVPVYEAYKALGTPEEITAKVAAGDASAARVTELEREAQRAKLAEFIDLDVLATLKGTDDLEFTIEGEDDARAVTVKPPDAEKAVPVEDYAQEHWPAVADKLLRNEQPPIDPVQRGVYGGAPQVPVQRAGGRPPAPKQDQAKIEEQKRREYAGMV